MTSQSTTNTYAVVDAPPGHVGRARVTLIHRSHLDAGAPDLALHLQRLAGPQAWVWVDGPAEVGDELDIDEEGCARVVE